MRKNLERLLAKTSFCVRSRAFRLIVAVAVSILFIGIESGSITSFLGALAFLFVVPVLLLQYGWSEDIPNEHFHVIPAVAAFLGLVLFSIFATQGIRRWLALSEAVFLWLVYGYVCLIFRWSP